MIFLIWRVTQSIYSNTVLKNTFAKTKAKELGQWPFENNKIIHNLLP